MNMGEAVVWNTCEMCWCFCYRRSRFHDMSRGLKHFMWSEIEIAANLFWLAGAVVTTLVTHSFSVRPICSHWGDSLAKTSFSPFSCSPGWWMTSRSLSDDCLAAWRRDTLTTSAAFWKSFKQEALRAATTKCSGCDSLSQKCCRLHSVFIGNNLRKDTGAQTNTCGLNNTRTAQLYVPSREFESLKRCWGHRINGVHLRVNMKINFKNKISMQPNWGSRNLHAVDLHQVFFLLWWRKSLCTHVWTQSASSSYQYWTNQQGDD